MVPLLKCFEGAELWVSGGFIVGNAAERKCPGGVKREGCVIRVDLTVARFLQSRALGGRRRESKNKRFEGLPIMMSFYTLRNSLVYSSDAKANRL